MPAVHSRRWTIEEVDRLAEQRPELSPRYELVDGELLVTPAPSARRTPDSRFEPDIFVIPAADGRMPRAADPVTQLLLAVEALSPSSARHDRITKRRFFQKHDVPEYWVVDGEAEAFEIWHPGDERAALVDDRLVWQPSRDAPLFELDVRVFFAGVADPPA
ncbi:MAG: Uma2 family endonuclease [Gemmatimonadales bacterium]